MAKISYPGLLEASLEKRQDGYILFQIFFQHKDVTCLNFGEYEPENDSFNFTAEDGFGISSINEPDITPDTLYLRGSDTDRDDSVALFDPHNLDSNQDEYLTRVLKALDEWAYSEPRKSLWNPIITIDQLNLF